jgi:hypothetical protein
MPDRHRLSEPRPEPTPAPGWPSSTATPTSCSSPCCTTSPSPTAPGRFPSSPPQSCATWPGCWATPPTCTRSPAPSSPTSSATCPHNRSRTVRNTPPPSAVTGCDQRFVTRRLLTARRALRSVRHAARRVCLGCCYVPLATPPVKPGHQRFVTRCLMPSSEEGGPGGDPPPRLAGHRARRQARGAGGACCPAVKGECPAPRRRAGPDGGAIRA